MSSPKALLSLLAIKKIVEETSTFTGKDFFRMLVKNLAETLELHGVWVTEYDPKENFLHSLAFWLNEEFVPKYDYCVVGTPCEPVLLSNDIFHVPERVIELFPDDPDLPPLNAVSYVGLALKDEKGEVLGHLAALNNRPTPELPEFFAIFKLFASRAEAELRRLKYERRLIEKEAKLTRLVNGAMNGIFEMDENLNITQANPAALKLFGLNKADDIIGSAAKNLLSAKGFKKVLDLIPFLNDQDGQYSALWIPGHVECLKRSGDIFHVEASLSKFSDKGKVYYVFFVVNIQERLIAEKQVEMLQKETSFLKEEIRSIQPPGQIVGKSPGIQKVFELVQQVGPANTTVLITGETGTGKELLARAIHESSQRYDKTMITINCAALPPELIESELFGHIKGAFTGALANREGRFVLADHSTLFLDEIGEMPMSLQAKLLRVLQEGEVQPVGSSKTIKVDVRIIAATNRNLAEEVRNGHFREDLYYRLNVFPIHLPPLRERGDDVIDIAEVFISKNARKFNKQCRLDDLARHHLSSYPWPGNIRELQNVIERALIMSKDGILDIGPLIYPLSEPVDNLPTTTKKVYTAEELKELERQNILRALELTNWKVSGEKGAAALLGIPSTTLNSKIKAFGLTK